MFRKKLILLLTISLSWLSTAQDVPLHKNWKFSKGDHPDWSKADFNDKDWKDITVGIAWEAAGYEGYDGHAWYRNTFQLPLAMKENSIWKDSVEFILGIIDDHDKVYLNGVLIAQNAGLSFEFGNTVNDGTGGKNEILSAYNIPRRYVLPANHKALRWDKENVLAVHVFDQLGEGGMRLGPYYASMVDVVDFIECNTQYSYMDNQDLLARITLNSTRKEAKFRGNVKVEMVDFIQNKVLLEYSKEVFFDNEKSTTVQLSLDNIENTDLRITYKDANGKTFRTFSSKVPYILTPLESTMPRIHGPKVYGARPGSPFLFKIPATGKGPLVYEVAGLPDGLRLNANTGIIEGAIAKPGKYITTVQVSGIAGKAVRLFTIQIGQTISLTPPMGWNSWNAWGLSVSDEKVRQSAKAMVDKGLINYGWTYVNIDDGWEADERNQKGELLPNSKFPDMKQLATDIHAMGLKLGIYSSPGPKTCGQYLGSYGYEDLDAQTWANWGIDYLKYDWCTYSEIAKKESKDFDEKKFWKDKSANAKEMVILQKPYTKMMNSLKKVNRDIVYSLCQYGMGNVWEWGARMNGQCWRTTGDITDTWSSLYSIGFSQYPLYKYAKPGRWNDPDMLIVGKVGWGPKIRDTRLTIDEQYTHISLWALLSAPLLIGCDMAQLDDFTLGLLKNTEVIDINQDELGMQAQRILKKGDIEVWSKKLVDGSTAIGIFNLNLDMKEVTLTLQELQLTGAQIVRNVWKQQDLGSITDSYQVSIPSHGVKLLTFRSLENK